MLWENFFPIFSYMEKEKRYWIIPERVSISWYEKFFTYWKLLQNLFSRRYIILIRWLVKWYFQVEFCTSKRIPVTAYSPLGSRGFITLIGKNKVLPSLIEIPIVKEIAEKYDKTPAQVLLRFLVQNRIAVIPKSTNRTRLQENFQVTAWELGDEDVEKLKNLDQGAVARIFDFAHFKGIEKHPEFPF